MKKINRIKEFDEDLIEFSFYAIGATTLLITLNWIANTIDSWVLTIGTFLAYYITLYLEIEYEEWFFNEYHIEEESENIRNKIISSLDSFNIPYEIIDGNEYDYDVILKKAEEKINDTN